MAMEKQNHVCKNCGRETENQIELVTLKTMVDRGWKKNKYFQAMGDIINTALCDDCLDEHIAKVTNPCRDSEAFNSFPDCFCGLFISVLVCGSDGFPGFLRDHRRDNRARISAGIEENHTKGRKGQKLSDTERRKAMATDLLSRLLPKSITMRNLLISMSAES